MHCLFCDVLCIVCVYTCTVLLPPGVNPIAVKYIISSSNRAFWFDSWQPVQLSGSDQCSVFCTMKHNGDHGVVWCLCSSTTWHCVTGWMASYILGPALPQFTQANILPVWSHADLRYTDGILAGQVFPRWRRWGCEACGYHSHSILPNFHLQENTQPSQYVHSECSLVTPCSWTNTNLLRTGTSWLTKHLLLYSKIQMICFSLYIQSHLQVCYRTAHRGSITYRITVFRPKNC
jgi:hypothetical protein